MHQRNRCAPRSTPIVQNICATIENVLGVSFYDALGRRVGEDRAAEEVWVEDASPAGDYTQSYGRGTWAWSGSDPTPYSGSLALQMTAQEGYHQDYYLSGSSATQWSIATGDALFAHVYLDPDHVPDEVMLQWIDDAWVVHRAYWGQDVLLGGAPDAADHRSMGALPTAGGWQPLVVPASAVDLEGHVVISLAFTLYGGRAAWDDAGQQTGSGPVTWLDDAPPSGADTAYIGADSWHWAASNPAPYSGSLAHQMTAAGASDLLQDDFWSSPTVLTIAPGDVLFGYVYLDPANPPSEIVMYWQDTSASIHRVFWGSDLLPIAGRHSMGALPASGSWVRLEVPASVLGLEGLTLSGMGHDIIGGHVAWDRAGVVHASSSTTVDLYYSSLWQVIEERRDGTSASDEKERVRLGK